MLRHLINRQTKLTWMGPSPGKSKIAALLIPQYNEGRNSNFKRRLEYFDDLARMHSDRMDVILIDDGSTDDSLQRLVDYREEHKAGFFIASVTPNGNKVGALFVSVISVIHEMIILSDFDTDLTGIDQLISGQAVDFMEDNSLMGYYFRMLPHEGSGLVFFFQQLEYALQRVLYKFHQNEGSVRVMPGAGSCYKREILLSIYDQHSGLRNGEDREATLIGLKLGYKTTYQNKILALTRPPLSFKSLVKQRVRWNLGYLETFTKESTYYFREMGRFSRIGILTMIDVAIISYVLLFPFLTILIAVISLKQLLIFFASSYILTCIWYLNLMFISPEESEEFKEKRVLLMFLYPFFKITLDFLAWSAAIYKMMRRLFKQHSLWTTE